MSSYYVLVEFIAIFDWSDVFVGSLYLVMIHHIKKKYIFSLNCDNYFLVIFDTPEVFFLNDYFLDYRNRMEEQIRIKIN